MKNKEPKRFLSVRLTPAEFKEAHRHYKSSECHSLTEYVKKVLTNKPVTIAVRNESTDEALQCLTGIKNKLDIIEDHLEDEGNEQLQKDIAGIRFIIGQFYRVWLRL